MKKVFVLSVAMLAMVAFNNVKAQNTRPANAPAPTGVDKKDQKDVDRSFKDHPKGGHHGHHKGHHKGHGGNGAPPPHQ